MKIFIKNVLGRGKRKEERERETSNIVKISRVFGWRKSKKGAS